MTVKRVLGLGTYPTAKPVHGGQRRVAAIAAFYRSIGIEYRYAAIYDSSAYGPPSIGPHDLPLIATSTEHGPLSLTGDLLSGRQPETHEPSWHHFMDVIERVQPDAIQLEQPFMWPLVKRLRASVDRRLPLIYSSHNVEAPLKRSILAGAGMPRDMCEAIAAAIGELEAAISHDASLILCVSASDAEYYRAFRTCPVVIVPNGVDRPPADPPDDRFVRAEFGGNRFVFTVGSAYGPNIEGFCECVAKDGMFFCPPLKSIAICGGVAEGILGHPDYQRFPEAHSARVTFFPKIDDSELWAVKTACHAVLLPILSGGGSNLKSAEALVLGKWVVATPTALRGYESFVNAEGVIVANDRFAFRRGIAQVLSSPPLSIGEEARKTRESLYWDALFENSSLAGYLSDVA